MLPNVAIEPLRHGVHFVAPAAEIVPTLHGKHASPTPYWPAGQMAANASVKIDNCGEQGRAHTHRE